MLELYNTVHPYNTKINIAYYSESGWLSFFLNFLFSISPFEYLCFFEDPQRNHPFLSISKINEISIFNQMDLDEKSGFGSVDGAIYFDIGSENYFIFIHTINNKYKEACSIPEKNRLAFNKTINGRIELTYRFFCL